MSCVSVGVVVHAHVFKTLERPNSLANSSPSTPPPPLLLLPFSLQHHLGVRWKTLPLLEGGKSSVVLSLWFFMWASCGHALGRPGLLWGILWPCSREARSPCNAATKMGRVGLHVNSNSVWTLGLLCNRVAFLQHFQC